MLANTPFQKSGKLLGSLSNETPVHSYHIHNNNGMSMHVLDYGATVTNLYIPVHEGYSDVVLGFKNYDGYQTSFDLPGSPYFGTIVGRVAGRIANSSFLLGDKQVELTSNFGIHQLHGGFEGFSKKVWEVKQLEQNKITFYYFSKNGEEGFPGNLHVTLTYEITDTNAWNISVDAYCDEDTVVNITQHTYFKLDDKLDDLKAHQLKLPAQYFLDTNEDLIPTGNFLETKNSKYDLESFSSVPTQIDTTFVNKNDKQEVACLQSLSNNLQMKVFTNQPGTHIYVGGACNATLTEKTKASYSAYSGICFETQGFPDAVHHPNFPSVLLKKREEFKHQTTFAFEPIK